MARKRWTPQTEVTESLLKFREKRKWQLGYRRYVLEGKPSEAYARYFGLSTASLREWFELQFTEGLNWGNFGKAWQFDHIVPATYFDYSNEEDLLLCWSFINMRVERIDPDSSRGNRIDLLASRLYFQDLYEKTGFSLCRKMLQKIERTEASGFKANPAAEAFINRNKDWLEKMSDLSAEEFAKLNNGMSVSDILLEREILKKFG
jgi:hypothetical protein